MSVDISSLIVNQKKGNRAVILGDSIDYTLCKYSTFGLYLSGYTILANAAVAGNTTQQMLDRYDTDVGIYDFDTLLLKGGTNDIGSGVPISTVLTNLGLICKKANAAGASVLIVIPPVRNDLAEESNKMRQLIKNWCNKNSIDHVDPFGNYIDSTNGNWVAGNSSDGIHPLFTKEFIYGQTFTTLLPDRLKKNDLITPKCNILGGGKYSNPLMLTDTNADGLADGFLTNSFTSTLVVDSSFIGKAQRLILTSAPNSFYTISNKANTGMVSGKKYLATCKVKISAHDGTYSLDLHVTDGAVTKKHRILNGVYCPCELTASIEFTATAGGDMLFMMQLNKYTGANINCDILLGEMNVYEIG